MRTSRRRAAVVIAFALLAAGPALAANEKEKKKAAAEPTGPPTWHALRVTGGDAPPRIDHFWSKGRRLRSETIVAGIPVTTLVDAERYYVIDDMQMTGVAIERSPKALEQDRGRSSERPFGNEGPALIEQGAEVVRSEAIGGRACKVYRHTTDQGRREIWITDDKVQLPLRMEVTESASGAQFRSDYLDWMRDMPIPDAFFEPDPRVRIEEIGYEDYVKRSTEGPVGPAPVLYGDLLHGR